jgi:hypothetical protein
MASSGERRAEGCLRVLTPDGGVGYLDDFLFDGAGSEVWYRPDDESPDGGVPMIADHYDPGENVWVLRELTETENRERTERIMAAASGGGEQSGG